MIYILHIPIINLICIYIYFQYYIDLMDYNVMSEDIINITVPNYPKMPSNCPIGITLCI